MAGPQNAEATTGANIHLQLMKTNFAKNSKKKSAQSAKSVDTLLLTS